jgi:spore coat polysaccharide biosynthesis protein SpsF
VAESALIVLQARMGSRRCPGKVLAEICGRPMLAYCVERLIASGAGPVVVATTTLAEDDAVADVAAALGTRVCRGPADDVLGRFVLACRGWTGRFLVRATADNPAVDIDAPRRVLEPLNGGADYVVESGLPVGAAVEGVRVAALLDAATRAASPYDREHVTPWIRQRPEEYVVSLPPAPEPLRRPDLHLTVDTPADLTWLRHVFGELGGAACAPLTAVMDVAGRLAPLGGEA